MNLCRIAMSVAACSGIAAAITGIGLAHAPAAQAAGQGISVTDACAEQAPSPGIVNIRAYVDGNRTKDASAWRCQGERLNLTNMQMGIHDWVNPWGVNLERYCGRNFPGTHAHTIAPHDVFSWRCV